MPRLDGSSAPGDRLRRLRPGTIQGALLLVIAVAIGALVASTAVLFYEWYRDERAAELRIDVDMAMGGAGRVDEYVRDVEGHTRAVGAAVARMHSPLARDLEAVLTAAIAYDPVLQSMSWVDTGGRLVASTGRHGAALDPLEAEVVRAIQAGSFRSGVVRKRRDDAAAVVARGVRDGGGSLRGIVLAVIASDRLGAATLSPESAPGATLALLGSNGELLYPRAPEERDANAPVLDPAVRSALRGEVASATVELSGVDRRRTRVTVAAAPVETLGWVVRASRPVHEAMAPISRGIRRSAALSAAVALAALTAVLLISRSIVRPLRRLQRDARALQYGSNQIEVGGPAEIRDLARAFHWMMQESQRREAALEASEASFRDLAECSPDLVYRYRLTPRRGFDYVSRSAASIVGFTPEEYYADPDFMLKLVHPDDRALLERRIAEGPVGANTELRWIRKDGAVIWIEARDAAVEDPSGEGVAIEGVARDITRRKEAELAVSEALASSEDLLRMISHDLRTPLNAVIMQAHLLLRTPSDERKVATRAESILTSARRIARMTSDMVDTAHIEAGQLRLERKAVDVGEFAHQLVTRLEGVLDTSRIRVIVREPVVISADPDRLDRIVTNLLSNALKYSPGTADVVLEIGRSGGRAAIAVRDEGAGIPPEHLEHVFERFYRTKQARDRAEGLGLGLYITGKLVEAHGGEITVESAPGQGSTFHVLLPCSPPKPERAEAERAKAERANAERGYAAQPQEAT